MNIGLAHFRRPDMMASIIKHKDTKALRILILYHRGTEARGNEKLSISVSLAERVV